MIERILLRIGDYIFVLRPLILIPVWSFYLIGARAGRTAGADVTEAPAAGLVSLTGIMVAAYLINQVFDTDADRYNDKGHYLTRGIFSARTVIILALIALLAAMRAFSLAPDAQRAPLVVALVLSLLYSLPPVRMCARPFLDLLANAVGYGGVAFVCGYAAVSTDVGTAWWQSLPWVFLVGATFLHTTILDAEGDARANKRTTSVVIGIRASGLAAAALAAAGTALAIFPPTATRDGMSMIVFAVVLPVFAAAVVSRRALSSLVVQAATTVVTVAAVVAEPRFLILLVPLVLVARVYYRARFGISYPGPARRRGA